MKIKITQAGWAGYTGFLGQVEFADGISIDEVSRADASQLASIVSVEDAATGRNPSDAQRILDNADVAAVVEQRQSQGEQATVVSAAKRTKAELEALADTGGIKAVREVADPLGLKGNSIAELIEKILQTQG